MIINYLHALQQYPTHVIVRVFYQLGEVVDKVMIQAHNAGEDYTIYRNFFHERGEHRKAVYISKISYDLVP